MFSDIGTSLFGKSDKHMREDDNLEKIHYEKFERERNAYIAQAKEQREVQRQQATARLNAAHQREQQLAGEVTAAIEKLSASTYRLAEAKSNLAKTAADLQRLGNEELELV